MQNSQFALDCFNIDWLLPCLLYLCLRPFPICYLYLIWSSTRVSRWSHHRPIYTLVAACWVWGPSWDSERLGRAVYFLLSIHRVVELGILIKDRRIRVLVLRSCRLSKCSLVGVASWNLSLWLKVVGGRLSLRPGIVFVDDRLVIIWDLVLCTLWGEIAGAVLGWRCVGVLLSQEIFVKVIRHPKLRRLIQKLA